MNWYGIFFLVFFHIIFFINPCYASGESSPVLLLITVPFFLGGGIFIIGGPILFCKYEIRSSRQWRYMLVFLLEYFFLVVVMFFINHLTAIILLAFGLVGVSKWLINQEKLCIAEGEKSKVDKLVLIIISLPIVTIFLMFLLVMLWVAERWLNS